MTRLLPLAFLLALGCAVAEDLPARDPTPEPELHLPDEIPLAWVEDMAGSISYQKDYTSGPLAGQSCTEDFTINGANISSFGAGEPCDDCDLMFELYISSVPGTDCPGDHDLEEGRIGFALDQDGGASTLWYYSEGGWFGWGAGWVELATGDLSTNEDLLSLTSTMQWLDPDNDAGFGGNAATDDPCGFWGEDRCEFQGYYDIVAHLLMDEGEVEWVEE
jgi:hypothetical protein